MLWRLDRTLTALAASTLLAGCALHGERLHEHDQAKERAEGAQVVIVMCIFARCDIPRRQAPQEDVK